MKTTRLAIVLTALLLTRCAGSDPQNAGAHESSGLWNPLSSFSWSALVPWHWFGSAPVVSDEGVGKLSRATAMSRSAISDALGDDYTLQQGMRSENGNAVTFWRVLSGGQPYLIVYGHQQVERIDVLSKSIASSDGIRYGTLFSDHYDRAFGYCAPVIGEAVSSVECQSPSSTHIRYLFSGQWNGPEALIPPDAMLKNWTVSKIIWRA